MALLLCGKKKDSMFSKIRIEKKNNIIKYLIAFLIFQIFFVFYLYKSGLIHYDENDDYYLNAVVSGMFGDSFHPNFFNNVIYCGILNFLYKASPICNWMMVGYVIAIILSFLSIMYVCLKRDQESGIYLSVIFFLATFQELLCKVNFTRVAALSTCAGAYLIYYCLFFDEQLLVLILGTALLVWGLMLRAESAYLVLLFLALLGLKKFKELNKQRIIKIVIIVAVAGIVLGVNSVYYSSPVWSEVNERISLVSGPMDHDTLTEESADTIDWDKLNITDEDLRFLLSWQYSDRNVFSTSELEKLNTYAEENEITPKELVRNLGATVSCLCDYIIPFVCILLIFSASREKKNRIILLAGGMMMILVIDYFFMIKRPLGRVCIIPIISYLLVVVDDLLGIKFKKNIFYKGIIVVLLVATVINPWIERDVYVSNVTKEDIEVFKTFKNSVNKTNEDNYFLIPVENPAYNYATFNDIFMFPGKGVYDNCVLATGWTAILPVITSKLEEAGYKNSVYEAVVKNDNFYLVGDEGMLMRRLDFVRRHYAPTADISWVYSLAGNNAYSISEVPSVEKEENFVDWNVDSVIPNYQTGVAFFMVGGEIEGDIDKQYYAIISNDEKEYCYEIRCEDGRFVFGVPVGTWDGENAKMIIVEKEGNVTRDDDEYGITFMQ